MMAFAVTNLITGEVIDDPKYVKWYAEEKTQTEGEFDYKELEVKKCSD